MQYYYHADHLGSSSYITNLDAQIVQHVEYVPFGEVFIEERNQSWNTPYLFNGKELDEETGLYYYGARYYNPRESVWLSTDPLAEKYPNVSLYAYTFQNPIKFIDPTGMEGIDPEDPPVKGSWIGIRDNDGNYHPKWTSSIKNKSEALVAFGNKMGEGKEYQYYDVGYTYETKDNRTVELQAGGKWDYVVANKESTVTALPLGGSIFATLNPGAVLLALGTIAGSAMLTSDSPQKITLYRGVSYNHPDYINALMGIATPWDLDGHNNPELHNGGNYKSIFTSWSLSRGGSRLSCK